MVGEQSLVASTRRRWWLPSALSTSLVLHGSLLASGAWLLTRGVEPAPPATQAVELSVELEPGPVELPVVSGLGDPRGSVRSLPDDEPRAQGGAKHPRVADPRAGKGGDATSAPAVNLSDSDDEVSLTVATFNALDTNRNGQLTEAELDAIANPNPGPVGCAAGGSSSAGVLGDLVLAMGLLLLLLRGVKHVRLEGDRA